MFLTIFASCLLIVALIVTLLSVLDIYDEKKLKKIGIKTTGKVTDVFPAKYGYGPDLSLTGFEKSITDVLINVEYEDVHYTFVKKSKILEEYLIIVCEKKKKLKNRRNGS